jgi:hypothetical protein
MELSNQTSILKTMQRFARVILGVVIVGLVLYAANLATRDCTVGPYVYDNCMWLRVRAHLGLPASRLLRMATLEFVGIVLASALYLTFRYVFPSRRTTPIPEGSSQSQFPTPPLN